MRKVLSDYEIINTSVASRVWVQINETTYRQTSEITPVRNLPTNWTRDDLKTATSCDAGEIIP